MKPTTTINPRAGLALPRVSAASAGRVLRRAFGPSIIPRSLFWRSLLIIVLPIVILQLILSYVFYNRVWDNVTRWLATGVAGEVAIVSEMLEQADTPAEIAAAVDLVRRHTDLRISFEPGA